MDESLISSDDETPASLISEQIEKYVTPRLKKRREFCVVHLAKYMKWNFAEKDLAKRTIEALYVFAANMRKDMKDGEAKQNVKEGMRDMRTIYDPSPLSKWNLYWEEREGREKEIAESTKRKRKIVSLMNSEVIEAIDERQSKAAKAQCSSALIPQVRRILQTSSSTTPSSLQTISDYFNSENTVRENFSSIFEFGSNDLLSQIPLHLFEPYEDYVEELYANFPAVSVAEFIETLLEPLEAMALSTWDKYFEELPEPAIQLLKEVQAVIKSTMPSFIKGFDDSRAPLNNAATLECEYLNSFIHPIFEKCVYHFGNKSEVPHKFFVGNTKGDAMATLNGRDSLPIAYFEGSRPFATSSK
ncbi:hypothetical protein HDU84_006197 [Entophlyctis sp. JEL0112]|nr:hypothetical protein HDU84_006197 [Entophlyctis sp. JEL0112]